MNLEDRNYWNDPRVIAGLENSAYKVVASNSRRTKVQLSEGALESMIDDELLPEDHDGILEGGTKFEVCGMCRGSGKTVNPSIDAGGLTAEDFDEDPEFRESYMNGAYDIMCPECGGEKVVPHIVFDDEKIAKAIEKFQVDEARYARELAHERAMGY